MKKLLLVLAAFVLVLGLSACGGGNDEPLQMLWWSDGTEGDVMQGLIDDYTEETGVEIELVLVPYNDYETNLATRISGGEAPALARVTEGHLNNFKANILPLDDVYATDGYTNLFFNDEGEVISLPMDVTANGMFVNLDLLDKYGVDYPTGDDEVWTWDEFETEMKKLDGDDVVTPGVFDGKAHRFMPLIYQSGVTIWDEAYTTSNLTSQAAVDTVEMFMRFFDEDFLDRNAYLENNAANLFKTGNYGFHISGNWNVSGYQDLTFDWTVVPMPQGENRATILGGKSLAAFDGSGQEDEAQDFIAWMAEAEQHDTYTGSVPYLTPRLGAVVDYGDFTEEYSVFLDEIAATDAAYVQDWLAQVMIPGMYPIINQFAEDAASGNFDSALELLEQLEADLKEAAPTE